MNEVNTPTSGSDQTENAPPVAKRKIPGWLKTSMAIALSLGLLIFYFKDLDLAKLAQATADANLSLAFFSILIPQVIIWLFTVYQNERSFTWFHKPFPWKDYLWVRGAIYLVMMINTAVGSGGSILYLQKKTGISWTGLFAILVFRILLHIAAAMFILVPLTLAMHAIDIFESTPLNAYLWWGGIILGLITFFDSWMYFFHDKSYGLVKYFFIEGEKNGELVGGFRNKDHEIWSVFFRANKRQAILTMLWVIPPLVSTVIGYWLFAYAFNIHIPFILFSVTIIIVLGIQDTPLAFAGFGATTLAWSLFYSDYASVEALASLTLCIPIMRLMIRAAIGLISLKPAIGDISEIIEEMKSGNQPKFQDIKNMSKPSGENSTVSEAELNTGA